MHLCSKTVVQQPARCVPIVVARAFEFSQHSLASCMCLLAVSTELNGRAHRHDAVRVFVRKMFKQEAAAPRSTILADLCVLTNELGFPIFSQIVNVFDS